MIYMVFDESVAQVACNTLNNHLFAGEFGFWAELSHTRSVEINSTCSKVRELAERIASSMGGRVQEENIPQWSQPSIEVPACQGGLIERAFAKHKREIEEKESCLLESLPYNKRIQRRKHYDQASVRNCG